MRSKTTAESSLEEVVGIQKCDVLGQLFEHKLCAEPQCIGDQNSQPFITAVRVINAVVFGLRNANLFNTCSGNEIQNPEQA